MGEFIKDGQNSWFVDYDNPESAKAKLRDITNCGGDGCLTAQLPGFASLGERFRTGDFAHDFGVEVIEPALVIGERQRLCYCALNFIPELIKRLCALLIFTVAWILLRIVTRLVVMLSRDPKLEVLGRLGCAVEVPEKKVKLLDAHAQVRADSKVDTWSGHFERAPSRKLSF